MNKSDSATPPGSLSERIAEQAVAVRHVAASFRLGHGAEWADVDAARRALDALLDEFEKTMPRG